MKIRPFAFVAAILFLGSCGSENTPAPTESQETGPPQNAQSLQVARIGDGEIWLQWQGPDSGTQYVVYRAENDGVVVALDSTFNNSYRDLGLSYEVEYSYYVIAMLDDGEEGIPTNLVSGQPFNNLSPQAPGALRATAHNISVIGQLEIVLDWGLRTVSRRMRHLA